MPCRGRSPAGAGPSLLPCGDGPLLRKGAQGGIEDPEVRPDRIGELVGSAQPAMQIVLVETCDLNKLHGVQNCHTAPFERHGSCQT